MKEQQNNTGDWETHITKTNQQMNGRMTNRNNAKSTRFMASAGNRDFGKTKKAWGGAREGHRYSS